MADAQTMTPIAAAARAKAAGPQGAGAALAMKFIGEAEETGKMLRKVGDSMKTKLGKLVKLDAEDINQFIGAMKEKRDALNAAAEKKSTTLSAMRKGDPAINYLVTDISEWLMFADAAARGWKPAEIGGTPWADLKSAARKHSDMHKQSTANNGEKPDPEKAKQSAVAQAIKGAQDSVKRLIASAQENLKAVGLDDTTQKSTVTRVTMVEAIVGAMTVADLDELRAIAAVVERKLKVTEEAAKAQPPKIGASVDNPRVIPPQAAPTPRKAGKAKTHTAKVAEHAGAQSKADELIARGKKISGKAKAKRK